MSVDDIIKYLYSEAAKGHVFSLDDLDKAVEACSPVDSVAKPNAITVFYSGGEDQIINEMAASGNTNVRRCFKSKKRQFTTRSQYYA